MDPISAAGPIKQTAVLLFYGWGYNFYREENKLRADDLLIRNKVAGILADARAMLKGLEDSWRREHLPPPTREQPFADRASTEQARRIARAGTLIEEVATAIKNAATPTNDKVWIRHRSERGLLEILQGIDVGMTDAAVAFHDAVVGWDLQTVSDPAIEQAMAAALGPLKAFVRERAERLTLMV